MGGLDDIKQPEWKGRNEALKFLNIKDSEAPRHFKKTIPKYMPLLQKLQELYETGQPFAVEVHGASASKRVRGAAQNICKRRGWDYPLIQERMNENRIYFFENKKEK